MYKRVEYQQITERLKEQRKFIQVVIGPRQVGKTTVVKQVLQDIDLPYQQFSADHLHPMLLYTLPSYWLL